MYCQLSLLSLQLNRMTLSTNFVIFKGYPRQKPSHQGTETYRSEPVIIATEVKSPSFSRCHRAVPVDAFYSSCVYDLCACSNETACLCDILSSYAKECAKAGVRLEWRSATLCAFDCDRSRGFLFDECGPVCMRTCNNWRTQLGELSENCYKPCVAGCQCPADKVVHNGRCISKTDCPKKNV